MRKVKICSELGVSSILPGSFSNVCDSALQDFQLVKVELCLTISHVLGVDNVTDIIREVLT